MAALQIQLLDGFALHGTGGPVVSISAPRQQELLAYLLLRSDVPQRREQIAFLLWPETTDSQARNNLRRELFRLRSQWPDVERWLEIEAQTLRWRADDALALDVADFESALGQADLAHRSADAEAEMAALQRALDSYRGPLCPASYAEWMLSERERLAQAHLRALERLTTLYESHRRYTDAIQTAQRLLRVDPLAENSYRQLMRLYAAVGDRPQALRIYHTCATTLRRELGVDPDFETVSLHQRLLNREKQTPAAESASQPRGQDALVGRQREWRQMLALWRQAAAGQSRLLLIAGEAGIGKSRLAAELYEWVSRQGMAAARTRAYAAEGALAYLPVVEWLRSESLRPTLARLQPLWLGEVCRLLPELLAENPHIPPPPPLTEGWQRRQMLEGLCRACTVDPQPRLLLLDDLQWCDEATLAWLRFFLRFAAGKPVLLLCTLRPQELSPGDPVTELLDGLRAEGQLTEIGLAPLDGQESVALAAQVIGHPLEADQVALLLAETGGNPLFVVETAKLGLTGKVRSGAHSTGDLLPPRIYAVIHAQIERVSVAARQIIGVAAAMGRSFRFHELAAASRLDEASLVDGLDELWRRGIFREAGRDGYDFSHDRIRDVVYAEISPIRRPHIHRAIAQALERVYPEERDEIVARLAAHWVAAGELAEAAACYRRAGEVALQRLAYREAASHFQEALAALDKLPQSRAVKEQILDLLLLENGSLRIIDGWISEKMSSHTAQAVALSQEVGAPRQQMFALTALRANYMMQGQQRMALACAQQMKQLTIDFPGDLSTLDSVSVELQMAGVLWRMGQLESTRNYFAGKEDEAWHPSSHWEIHPLWLMGYGEQARHRLAAIRQIGERLPSEWMISHTVALQVCYGMRTNEFVEGLVADLVTGAGQYEAVFWVATGALYQGWLWTQTGQVAAGVAQMAGAIRRFAETGAGVLTLFLDMLASGYGLAGRYADALATLEQALAHADAGGEHFWYAELLRHKGEILLVMGAKPAEAESLFRQALATAHSQSARTLELRAAVSLGRLWLGQGRGDAARSLVSPLYNCFTEGFDTADLTDAREFLDRLK
ncbi:MAG: hypothetical protein DWI57_05465 [Chloroflexi bacterium]|nr:MAG: hypothetical protein DWI57_05465 [Chloroflexota bacterium]